MGITPETGALVLFSGGQDSTTCLAYALTRHAHVQTVGFDYGQRHRVELQARAQVLQALRQHFPHWGARLGADHLMDLSAFGQIAQSALTQHLAIAMQESGLPNTFVPGRNLLFLTIAAALAYRQDMQRLILGVCETDFSGYPDCRDTTMQAMQLALTLGMDKRFTIETPLMWLDKAQTWQLAQDLGGEELVELVIEHTHTCYYGIRETRYEWGYGCNLTPPNAPQACPACLLRSKGWQTYARARNGSLA